MLELFTLVLMEFAERSIHLGLFYVDESFWENKFNPERDGILFVGNDSNREFKKVVELANYFKNETTSLILLCIWFIGIYLMSYMLLLPKYVFKIK